MPCSMRRRALRLSSPVTGRKLDRWVATGGAPEAILPAPLTIRAHPAPAVIYCEIVSLLPALCPGYPGSAPFQIMCVGNRPLLRVWPLIIAPLHPSIRVSPRFAVREPPQRAKRSPAGPWGAPVKEGRQWHLHRSMQRDRSAEADQRQHGKGDGGGHCSQEPEVGKSSNCQ